MFFSHLHWGMQTVIFHLCFSFQTKACIPLPTHMFLGIWYFLHHAVDFRITKSLTQFSQWVFCNSKYRDNTGNHNTKALHFNLFTINVDSS
jgi:hypothetical protein